MDNYSILIFYISQRAVITSYSFLYFHIAIIWLSFRNPIEEREGGEREKNKKVLQLVQQRGRKNIIYFTWNIRMRLGIGEIGIKIKELEETG